MMKEAMSLLEFAVNVDETERRRYLSKLGRFGEEKEPGILLQKELLELSGQIPVTEPMRRYFERYQENSLGCLARNLLCTFDAEETDNAQEMKEKVMSGLAAYSFDAFPDFSSYMPSDTGLPLDGKPVNFLVSVKKLELEERFKARMIFAFQDPEESLEELEAKNGKYLRFTVSNAALAANLLQSKLGIQNIEVDSANELTVRDLQLDTGAAVRLFVDAGLSVSDAHLYEDTLEDYFKQVTGGEGIA